MADFRFELLQNRTRPGKPERRKFQKLITDNDIAFPNTVSLTDIDHAFEEFVDKELSVTYDGTTLPTISTMSNQRLAMYGQSWQCTDEANNILLNFKMFNREIDVKKGTIVGEMYNIPGHRDHVIGYKAVRQEDMLIGYDVYTVKEPTALDLTYKVNIVTNKRELISVFTQKVYHFFNGLEGYIFPRGHAMSMRVVDVVDESEYSIDDRKFYSQGFNILVKAYCIEESDFIITHRPIRKTLAFNAGGDDIYKKGVVDGEQVILTTTAKGDTNTTSIIYNGEDTLLLESINLNNISGGFCLFINEEKMEIEDTNVTIEPEDSLKFTYVVDKPEDDVVITLACSKQAPAN